MATLAHKLRKDDLVYKTKTKKTKGKAPMEFGYILSDPEESPRITWYPSGREEKFANPNSVPSLKICDRFFYPGDFVKTISDHKVGYVLNVKRCTAASLLHEDCVAVNVDTLELLNPKIFTEEDTILYDNLWVGQVVKVRRSVNIYYTPKKRQSRGEKTLLTIPWDDLQDFLKPNPKEDAFGRHNAFYNGLMLGDREWKETPESPLPELSRDDFMRATITHVLIDNMDVRWIKCLDNLYTKPFPDPILSKKDIGLIRRLFKPFNNLLVHVGSIQMLNVTDKHIIVSKKSWDGQFLDPSTRNEKYRQQSLAKKILRGESCIRVCVEVIETFSKVQVIWMTDGNVSTEDSTNLVDFFESPSLFPGQYGFLKYILTGVTVFGIIQSVDFVNNMATLRIYKSANNAVDYNLNVSLYEITPGAHVNLEAGTIIALRDTSSSEIPKWILGYIMYSLPNGNIVVMQDDHSRSEITLPVPDPERIRYIYPGGTRKRVSNAIPENNLTEENVMVWTVEDRLSIEPQVREAQKLAFLQVPKYHSFYKTIPNIAISVVHEFKQRMKLEFEKLVQETDVPISIIAFNDRCDLYSVLLLGRPDTPYEHFLLAFDVYLPENYPRVPPVVRYVSMGATMIHTMILPGGIVNIPTLHPRYWSSSRYLGEVFNFIYFHCLIERPSLIPNYDFNKLEYGLSIKSIIQDITAKTKSRTLLCNSRCENEILVLNILDSVINMLADPMPLWKNEILQFFRKRKYEFAKLLDFVKLTPNKDEMAIMTVGNPVNYPLFPMTKGGYSSLRTRLEVFITWTSQLEMQRK